MTITPYEKRKNKLLANLDSFGWKAGLTDNSYLLIAKCNFRKGNAELAAIASEIAFEQQPITLRGLFYQIVSTGFLPSTDDKHYKRVGRVISRLRSLGIVPYTWIVDNLRSTKKPSSWTGLNEFTDTVRDAYRKDFWHHLPNYVHIFCEKDAVSGTIYPTCNQYDVSLSPVRGYCSDSFAHEIGSQWQRIEKPIFAYYLGDYDPSGFDIERDLKKKLRHHAGVGFHWQRLGVNQSDFDEFNLVKLVPKRRDKRCKAFLAEHGEYCAEIDAIPPNEIRRRVEEKILELVPPDEWERLQNVERLEKESFESFIGGLEG